MPEVIFYTGKQGKIGYKIGSDDFVDAPPDIKKNHINTKDSEAVRLAIINQLLADRRQHARDHEGEGAMFHGSALVKTTGNKWFIHNNIHVQRTETTRTCAEANAISEAISREGNATKIEEVYFMGGQADYDRDQPFLTPKGTRFPPCGSCLDVIHRFRKFYNGETIVHMLPLGNGKEKLKLCPVNDSREMSELTEGEIYSRKISELFPHFAAQLNDKDGSIKSMIKHGHEWLKDESTLHAIADAHKQLTQQMRLESLQRLDSSDISAKDRISGINAVLMESAKEYYHKLKSNKPHELTVAIVRSEDGHYYIGLHAKNGKLQATSPAEVKAIEAMLSDQPEHRFTDIFIVKFDQQQLEALNRAGKTDSVSFTMPSGADRQILQKNARNGTSTHTNSFLGVALSKSDGFVHIFPPNDPTSQSFDPEKYVVTFPISSLLPVGYKNPKHYGVGSGYSEASSSASR